MRKEQDHPIHPDAIIHPDAEVDTGTCIIGPGAQIGAHAQLCDCIVWPNVHVPQGKKANNTILCR